MPFEYRLRHDTLFQDGAVRKGVYTIVGDLYPVRARFVDKYYRDTLVLCIRFVDRIAGWACDTSRGDGATNVNRRLLLRHLSELRRSQVNSRGDRIKMRNHVLFHKQHYSLSILLIV